MNDGWMIGLVLLIMVPLVIVTTLVPYLTRKIECFGVTIPAEAQMEPTIIALKKQYVWLNGGLGIILTIVLAIGSTMLNDEKAWSILLTSVLIIYMILSFVFYYKQHKQVKALKQSHKWFNQNVQRVMVNTAFRKQKLTVSYLWFLPHIFIVIATLLTGVLGYDYFPDQIPMKFNLNGEITNIASKTYGTVLWPVFAQITMLLIFVLVQYGISSSKQIIESSDPEGSVKRNIIFRQRWSKFSMVFSFLLIAMFYFIMLSMRFDWSGKVQTIVPLVFIGLILIGTLILTITTGQGGSRIKLSDNAERGSETSADHDKYWKLGLFYFNWNDPAIFVEKRFGVGWTINFARPIAWIILLAIIALPILARLIK